MKAALEASLSKALRSLGVDGDALVEHPGDLKNGDYSSGVALKFAKQLGLQPREFAEKIVAGLGKVDGVEKTEIAGAGFINFYLAASAVAASVEQARAEDMWGSGASRKGKTIMVEYTDPNPFKEFHIGHLMSNAIGESIARLLQFSGAKVLRANYQGDVGPHVAKAIWALMKKGLKNPSVGEISTAYQEGAAAYEENESSKGEIDAINKKVYEKSDPAINDLYDQGRKVTLEHFEELYKILGTQFDYYFFESDTGPRGVKAVNAHPEIFEESEGATVFKAEKFGLHTRVFLNKQGLPTYEAKDLGLAEIKKEKSTFDTSMSVTAHEQSDYFKVVLKAIELIHPEWKGQFEHIAHGMMRFAEGKMSSRKGNVITGESLLDELTEAADIRAAESRADDKVLLGQQVAVAAIKYQILRQASSKDIIFDRGRALSLEGDSGPYVQYAYARAHAVVEKAKEQGVAARADASAAPSDLTRLLHRFPELVERAADELEPHILTTYLLEIASTFNSWYAQEQILDGTPAAANKVAIAEAVARTLKNGLWILGIPAPEKM